MRCAGSHPPLGAVPPTSGTSVDEWPFLSGSKLTLSGSGVTICTDTAPTDRSICEMSAGM